MVATPRVNTSLAGLMLWMRARRRPRDLAKSSGVGATPVVHILAALESAGLDAVGIAALDAVGERDWTRHPPREPVDHRRVANACRTLRRAMPSAIAPAVLARAGRLAADDLIARRVPAVKLWALRRLPAGLAIRLATPLVTGWATVFKGSGASAVLDIADDAFCVGEYAGAPVCAWQAALLERLVESLLGRTAQVVETHCHATGDECCRFEISWGASERRQRVDRRLGLASTPARSIATPRRNVTWACIAGKAARLAGEPTSWGGPWG